MYRLDPTPEDYRKKRFSVIPLRPKSKKPLLRSWKEFQQTRATSAQVRAWWQKWPAANVAIVTGKISDVIVIDCDSDEATDTFMANYPEASKTLQSITGKGRHFYFKWTKGIRNNVRTKLGPKIDVRGDGGYVVAPPSVHENGKTYKWLNNNSLQPLSEPIKELLRRSSKTNMKTKTTRASTKVIKEGRRNITLTSHAGTMHAKGMDQDSIRAALMKENAKKFAPPLPREEIEGIVQSITTNYPSGGTLEKFTDAGNCRRFANQFGNDVRYCKKWNTWFIWNGIRWEEDAKGEVTAKATKTVQSIYFEAGNTDNSDLRRAVNKHADKSESAYSIKAMLSLAQYDPRIAVDPSAFDANPFLLNVKNGTIDLESGKLRPHRREDFMTKLVPVDYDAHATCPIWDEFLNRILKGNKEMINFLQRSIGYALTGQVTEQVLFFLYGRGANGKSTFLNVAQKMLGDYAKSAAPELLVSKHANAHPTELADLHGSRFVVAMEIDEGRFMAEARVKILTGGDKIKARRMHQDFFEFNPSHKLFLAANHKPMIRGTDHAIWRRLRLIPFGVQIPDAQQDKELEQKLLKELPGILAWAVRGCKQWRKIKLVPPKEVQNATNDYQAEMDMIANFLKDCCEQDDRGKTKSSDLYKAYSTWCDANGERKVNQTIFAARLKDKGFENKRGRGGYVFWCGIVLNEKTLRQLSNAAQHA